MENFKSKWDFLTDTAHTHTHTQLPGWWRNPVMGWSRPVRPSCSL